MRGWASRGVTCRVRDAGQPEADLPRNGIGDRSGAVVRDSGVTGSSGARAAARAARFREAGHWTTEPVDLVADAAARYPEHRALVARDRALTYRDLDAAVHGAARALRERGVGPGDPVLMLVGNDVT